MDLFVVPLSRAMLVPYIPYDAGAKLYAQPIYPSSFILHPLIRIAQYGTKHGHAAGKLAALRDNPRVELAGVWEPDVVRRHELAHKGAPYRGVRWFEDVREVLEDPGIVAVAAEGRNDESLDQVEELVKAGKHVWCDKPAGENWEQWQRIVALAEERMLLIQMGYMFRYHDGFQRIAHWVQSGLLSTLR